MKTILIFDQAESAGGSIARAVDLANGMSDLNFIFITYHPLKTLYHNQPAHNVKAKRVFSFYNYQKKQKHQNRLKELTQNTLLIAAGEKIFALFDWINEYSVLAQAWIKITPYKIDLIQANCGIHFLPYRLAKIKKAALIYYFRHLDDYRWASPTMLNRASHFVFVGANLMASHLTLLNIDRARCHVVHSPFDAASRLKREEPTDLNFLLALKNKGYRIIVQAARVCRDKGQNIAIDAIIKLKESHPNIALILAGEFEGDGKDEYERTLRSKIKEHQLENRVLLIGQRKDILQILQHADVALQAPIWFEAIGGALVESMQLGILTISADTGGTPEVIKHNHTGLLFTPGDSEGLAHHLEEIMLGNVDVKSIANAGKEHTLAKWNPEAIQNKIRSIYTQSTDEFLQKNISA